MVRESLQRMNAAGWKWVFVGGMIRSGSTLQYQIARELVETRLGGEAMGFLESDCLDAKLAEREAEAGARFPCVVKSHVCTAGIRERLDRGEAIAFYTYRDPRDVVISGSRNFGIPLDEFISGRLLDQAVGEGYLWTSCRGVSASSFEALTADPEGWIRGMMRFLGVEEDTEQGAARLAAEYSLEQQKARIERAQHTDLGGFSVDPDSLLHRNHIDRAAVGGWRGQLDADQVREIERRAGDWMADYGYLGESGGGDGVLPTEREREFRRRSARYLQESDHILRERENLVKRLSSEAGALASRLGETEQLLLRERRTPQSLSQWTSLHWRRVCRKLRGSPPSAS